MNQSQYSRLFSFLWNIANDVLVQAFEKGDYKKVTLPFIVLRRLDLLLEPTKEEVLNFCRTEEFEMMPLGKPGTTALSYHTSPVL